MLIMLMALPIGAVLHFLPSILGRKRPDILIIFLVNLLAGWSIVGWFAAFYLALRKTPTVIPAAPSFPSLADELTKLRDLRNQGVLTQEEFERQKNNLLT
ncbi:hypothetical protein BXP70_12810 [Hymenobacter crusticola]|uniref:SHOCT domain-containing protein n=2 Tax=Hymenobacter crusticola TaxID=1770526 RepID=A0A243WDV0_9BACT|nr:hypothetical protein BXP70_12810 [Hymenobacter crusticola]